MRELTAFVHSNAKIQKRTDDAFLLSRDRVTKGLAFSRSTDNPPIEQERKHRLWTQMQEGETEEALLMVCFLSRQEATSPEKMEEWRQR